MSLTKEQFSSLDEYIKERLKGVAQFQLTCDELERKFGIETPFYSELLSFTQNAKCGYTCKKGWEHSGEPEDIEFIRQVTE